MFLEVKIAIDMNTQKLKGINCRQEGIIDEEGRCGPQKFELENNIYLVLLLLRAR